MRYVIFGAGNFGTQAIDLIGKSNIEFFIDNNVNKQKRKFCGFEVLSLENAKNKIDDVCIIIAMSDIYIKDVQEQLIENNINNYKTINQLKMELTKQKLLLRTDYVNVYNKAINWIKSNTINNQGIINNSNLKKIYPEVTGYYIPSLIRWGYRDLAIDYARYLCSIQNSDGAWYDTENKNPYIFDSAQILKGLIAVRHLYPEVEKHIIAGCDWILTNMNDDGKLIAPLKDIWGDGKTFSELIHTYCISPIKDAGIIYNRNDYIEKADKIAHYYTSKYREDILNFNLLSHFYAYVMEAMLDIGETSLVKEAMDKIETIQKSSGGIPAYNNVDWVCSTGLFQFAVVWFRLGELEKGNKVFNYACKLQNKSGGWYGSYLSEENENEINTYFPNSEISWAVKYFLDALYYKNLAQFKFQAPMFLDSIEITDGRYKCIEEIMKKIDSCAKVLDVGCGKGRYLKELVKTHSTVKYYAVDISLEVMKFFEIPGVEKKQGNLTNIPYENNKFDFTYSCEALEHAVDISSAIREMCRVTKSGGYVAVIDKNKDMLGYYDIEEWEQWFDENELKQELLKYCSDVIVKKNINFDDKPANGLFYCWIGKIT